MPPSETRVAHSLAFFRSSLEHLVNNVWSAHSFKITFALPGPASTGCCCTSTDAVLGMSCSAITVLKFSLILSLCFKSELNGMRKHEPRTWPQLLCVLASATCSPATLQLSLVPGKTLVTGTGQGQGDQGHRPHGVWRRGWQHHAHISVGQDPDPGFEHILDGSLKTFWGLPICQGSRERACPQQWGGAPGCYESLYAECIPEPRSTSSLSLAGAMLSCLPLPADWGRHTWGRVVKYKLRIFRDSNFELNALRFAFKPDIAQYKEE